MMQLEINNCFSLHESSLVLQSKEYSMLPLYLKQHDLLVPAEYVERFKHDIARADGNDRTTVSEMLANAR